MQDDGHIFCLPDQIATEIRGVLDMVEYVMGALGFSQLEINLSTKPAKAVGSDEIWERAEDALREALHTKGWDPLRGVGRSMGPRLMSRSRMCWDASGSVAPSSLTSTCLRGSRW